jgi:hypothetical protein
MNQQSCAVLAVVWYVEIGSGKPLAEKMVLSFRLNGKRCNFPQIGKITSPSPMRRGNAASFPPGRKKVPSHKSFSRVERGSRGVPFQPGAMAEQYRCQMQFLLWHQFMRPYDQKPAEGADYYENVIPLETYL